MLRGLGAIIGAGSGKTVGVCCVPALRALEFHPVKPQGLLRHVLDVDLEEYFLTFKRIKEGRRRFRNVNFGLYGQRIGDLTHGHKA